jgi:hypothetical protein
MPKIIMMNGQIYDQKLMMYPLASKNKAKPIITIIVPKTKPAIMPPLGKPKHSFSTRL